MRHAYGICLAGALILAFAFPVWPAAASDAEQIVAAAFEHLRGRASVSEVDMTVHRPAWERTMRIRAWTRGETESLFRITAPAKDVGNGTLKMGRQMWIYNPKIQRVIKVPPSMMSQAWMGSDFSNNDLAKTDSILNDYSHSIVAREEHGGQTVFVIESVPKPGAPVVWGMQRLKIRADHVWLEQAFFDEERRLVKIMTASDIAVFGDRLFPGTWIMRKAEDPEAFTRLHYRSLSFLDRLSDRIFTLANLKNPRREP
jgi:outer membrane lipoprotein-sorting protein